jgi:UDP-N-acetylmuramoylalanine--D-glutamate ligase
VTPRPPLPDGPYLVVGLARSGVAALEALRARGLDAIGVDAGAPAVDLPDVFTGVDGVELLDRAATVVKSPGVPQEAPVVAQARARGLTVLGELELGWRLLPNRFVAVTGTNGKTTTVALLGHVLGERAVVAGNVGTALTSLDVPDDVIVVAEASSFQLEDTLAFAPDVGALINLGSDHLDRHGDLEAYRAAKLRMFVNQAADDVAVIPDGLQAPGQARRVRFGGAPTADLRLLDGALWWEGERLMATEEIRLRGPHNLQNAMVAAACALSLGVDPRAGLATFAGVPHRLEEIATVDGVLYVNDSKATNVESALVALRSFPSGVRLIVGGRGKGQDFRPLAADVGARCASVHLIGEDGERVGAAVGGGFADGDLETAVEHARSLASPGDVVLLSPACASYDQFKDFEARGEAFRAVVGRIAA